MNTKEMLKPTKTNKQECNQLVTTKREKLEGVQGYSPAISTLFSDSLFLRKARETCFVLNSYWITCCT